MGRPKRVWQRIRMLTVLLLVFTLFLQAIPMESFAAQTANYATIGVFQANRWLEIENAMLEKTDGSDEELSDLSPLQINTMLGTGGGWQIAAGNDYFNWVDKEALEARGIEAWNGSSSSVSSMTTTYQYEDTYIQGSDGTTQTVSRSQEYDEYNVSNASELVSVLVRSMSSSAHIKINLTNDINLNGQEQRWLPRRCAGVLYIEGNGHTIYNMRAYSNGDAGFVGDITGTLIIKNLNFQSSMVLAQCTANDAIGTVFGNAESGGSVYLYNVHAREGYVYSSQSRVGGFIGESYTGRNVFIKNCSNEDYYIRGLGMTGGFASYIYGATSVSGTMTYDCVFPDVPEAFLGNTAYKATMMEDCYSINCEVFTMPSSLAGETTISSGGMVGMVAGSIIRDCYTNNTVYGKNMTGGFVGRVLTGAQLASNNGTGTYYDDARSKSVSSYFESCYASGSVEGENKIGGFVGIVNAKNTTSGGQSIYGGNVVFKNCYSTASVGLDYSGTDIGGFIGCDESNCTTNMTIDVNGANQNVSGSAYINCYAAGEVGNILSDTTLITVGQNDSTLRQGGFIGSGYELPGYYERCYYDMQTTAMRERSSGDGTVRNGIAGVYTEGSSAKGMSGLTYSSSASSVTMADSSAWSYVEGYYPRLAVFEAQGAGSAFAVPSVTDDKVCYSVPVRDWISTEADGTVTEESMDMVQTTNNMSRASAATVFLNHWDSIINTATGTIPEENDWICGIGDVLESG